MSDVKALRLRCKHNTGLCVLENLTTESTVEDLLNAITKAVGVNRNRLAILYGYPPKPLVCTEETLKGQLKQIPLLSGDTLTVNVSKQASGEVPAPPPALSLPAPPSGADNGKLAAATVPPSTEPYLVHLVAPSDNSCLFTSILFSVDNKDEHQPIETSVVTNPVAVAGTRELIASIVHGDPDRFSEAFLGMPNKTYCQCIQKPDHWGGGIEVAILSQVYEVEICMVDVQTLRIDQFGQDCSYLQRILLIYDGIHYDPLALAQPRTGRLKSIFSTGNNEVLALAQQLAEKEQSALRFIDLSSFSIICRRCQTPLNGQVAARKHAEMTGHTEFSEITR